MNWNEIQKELEEGIVIKSLVSNRLYYKINSKVISNGTVIKENFISHKEKNGEFTIVKLFFVII